ncbi:Hypothetical protein A7982_08540 [Minicystis rosea]|nr:Hypothetical protein A7982_08540 [Minicystis rosea]
MPVLPRVRAKLRDVAQSLDAFSLRLSSVTVHVLLWPLAYAVTLCAAVFLARHTSWLAVITTNKVPLADSFRMGIWTGIAIVAMGLFYGAVLLVRRLRRGASGGLATVAEINRRLRPVLAAPLFGALAQSGIERDSPKETFFFVLLCAFAVGAGVYAWTRPAPIDDGLDAPPPPSPLREGLAQAAATFSVAGLWAGYGLFFSWLSITNHRALNTRTTDLGYYDNIFWQSIHGRPLACSFIKAGYHGSAHFDPLLVVLSPLYLLHSNAEMLLVLQSVWLGMGVLPLYLLAYHKLGRRLPALAIAAMYALYPALHGANMYEFHSLTLLSPLVLTLLYFLEVGAFRAYFIALIPALLCREDVALVMCFVGAYCIYTRVPRMVRTGWLTILASLVYFGVVKKFFMTSADIFMSGKDSYSFAYYYEDLIPNHNGIGGLLLSILTNPVFVLRTMMTEPKIQYLLTLFVPVLFLPFVAKPGRVLLLYGLLFCLLASRSAVYSPHFQYSSVILPMAFALTPEAIRQIRDGRVADTFGLDGQRLARALVPAAFVASALVSWKFGGFIDNQAFRGGFVRVARGLGDKERETFNWIRETTAQIPANASVGTTNRLGAHVSSRRHAYFYPEHQNVDYLFIDENEIKAGELDKHNKNVQTGAFVLVARREKMALFKRGANKGAPAAAPAAPKPAAPPPAPAPAPPPQP